MAATSESAVQQVLGITLTVETIPARHERHGTPHPVVERIFTFTLPQGTVVVDQTDYGHAGRFNPCHMRRVPTALQPKTPQLLAAAEALASLL